MPTLKLSLSNGANRLSPLIASDFLCNSVSQARVTVNHCADRFLTDSESIVDFFGSRILSIRLPFEATLLLSSRFYCHLI